MRMKKSKVLFVIALLSIFVLTGATNVGAAGDPYGIFKYWYSDKDYMSYWKTNDVKVSMGKTPDFGMSLSNLTNYSNVALHDWYVHYGISCIFPTPESTADLVIKGIDRFDSNSKGFPSDIAGVTYYDGYTDDGVGTFQGANKYIHGITPKAHIYMVWDSYSEYKTSDFTSTEWQKLFTHEVGHSIGYNGHFWVEGFPTIMLPYVPQIFAQTSTSPSTRDFLHVDNVY